VGEGTPDDVTTTQHEQAGTELYPTQFEPPRSPAWRLFFGPGFGRALWMTPLFFALGMLITVGCRAWWGWDPVWLWSVIIPIAGLITAPIGFLAGIGAFDYWLHYISGRPTRPEDHSGHGARSWKDYFRVNTDHKVIGIQYLVTTVAFFIIGGLMAMLFRAELAQPGLQYFDSQTFNGLVSAHATLMIFLFIIPAFAGIANFVVPLMLGAPDMAFPRLNALSYWLLPIAGVMFLASFFAHGGSFATGWTGYAPIAEGQPLGQTFFNMGVQWAGASSVMTALNFLVTIITMRAPGMTFWRMPLLVWANFTTSLLVVIATPFIAGSQFFVMFDRILHTDFFIPKGGGYVLGYQHIFWFYSHPAVYIMMLPGFGIVSEVISANSRKPIFGYRLMALSLVGILVLGFSVWAHHMFVAGMANWLRVPMMITTLLIAVPTGIKVFSWTATLWRGRIHLTTPMLFALGFVTMFVIGGLSGIYLASVPIDIHASDTYFIVAHIHYVLFGGSVFTIFAGIYFWFPKMTGRMYDERLGKLHFWLTFVSFNATFFPMHYIGLRGMPRRVFDYDAAFGDLNFFITVASFVLGASVVIFIYNLALSWVRGPIAEANPWHAHTLEWQVSSPPPVFNFDEIPQVVGGPYEYGVPGARHAVLAPAREAAKEEEPVHA
jgi:cytochrome c oxidase subunit 1